MANSHWLHLPHRHQHLLRHLNYFPWKNQEIWYITDSFIWKLFIPAHSPQHPCKTTTYLLIFILYDQLFCLLNVSVHFCHPLPWNYLYLFIFFVHDLLTELILAQYTFPCLLNVFVHFCHLLPWNHIYIPINWGLYWTSRLHPYLLFKTNNVNNWDVVA